MIRNITFCLLISILLSPINITIAQEANAHIEPNIPKIVKFEGNILYLDNGKNVKIDGLNDSKKQVVFIVNHAQEDAIGLDPGLTYEGNIRAFELMRLLKNTNISNIYSILFRRTVLTARPLVKEIQIPIKHFDPGQIDYLTDNYFKDNPQNSLVVGTSTAVKDLLNEITISAQIKTIESHPYPYIYIVEMDTMETPVIHHFRY